MPTLARFPSATATSSIATDLSIVPSSTATATISPTASATITNTPFSDDSNQPTRILKSLVSKASPTNTLIPFAAVMTATPLPEVFTFGQSADGNSLTAFRYGTGSKIVMLVGGIHAGFEANTVELMGEIQEYLENNPAQIKSEVTFLIVPSLNPDGLTRGRSLAGRFNGNGVDLNRNWGCGWSEDAFFQERTVDPGDKPFSEPETVALGGLIQSISPIAVLFYHAAADGVYAGSCENHENVSFELASVYGEHSGYPSGEEFSTYRLTGTASSWVTSLGIPSVAVELRTSTQTDYERNLRAIIRLQEWIVSQ